MLTTHLATLDEVPAIQALAEIRTARVHALDPRLPRQEALLPSWMLLPSGGACWLAREDGRLVGALCAEPEYWPPDSPFANVFPRRYLRLRLFLGEGGAAAPVVEALMGQAGEWSARTDQGGMMLLAPARDLPLTAALRTAGFAPYHAIAHQPMPDFSPAAPPSEVTVRPAREADIDAVADLMAESWRFHAAHQPAIQISSLLALSCHQQAWQLMGDGFNETLLVAERAGAVSGFFAIGLARQDAFTRMPLFTPGVYGDIYEVGVRADRRRSGIGTAMYRAAWQWFHSRGVDGLFVNYAPTNPISSRFWPRLGFVDAWINWWRCDGC